MSHESIREQIARAICRRNWPDEQFWKGYLPDVDTVLALKVNGITLEELIRAAREGK